MARLIAAFTEEVKDYFQLFYGGWETADYRNNADAKRNQNLTADYADLNGSELRKLTADYADPKKKESD